MDHRTEERDLRVFRQLSKEFSTGFGSNTKRVPCQPTHLAPLMRSNGVTPAPRVSYVYRSDEVGPDWRATEVETLYGTTASLYSVPVLPALAPKIKVIEIADWFELPPHTECEMGSYRRLMKRKCELEERLFGYVPGYSIPKTCGSPFGPEHVRFRPMSTVDPFEHAPDHGFMRFVSIH